MPMYEFFCKKCDIILERYLPINPKTKFVPCWKCGGQAKKIISNSTFILKSTGVGWYADGYSKKK